MHRLAPEFLAGLGAALAALAGCNPNQQASYVTDPTIKQAGSAHGSNKLALPPKHEQREAKAPQALQSAKPEQMGGQIGVATGGASDTRVQGGEDSKRDQAPQKGSTSELTGTRKAPYADPRTNR